MAKILVVEDSAVFRDVLIDILETLDHEVRGVTNGKEALIALEAGHPDLMITDYIMPEMDGEELLRVVRGQGMTFRVIVMSGGADVKGVSFKHLFKELDVWRFLDKPFKVPDLMQILEDL